MASFASTEAAWTKTVALHFILLMYNMYLHTKYWLEMCCGLNATQIEVLVNWNKNHLNIDIMNIKSSD